MNNNMLPEGHKILKILKETKAEYTFRAEYEGKTEHGQFFMLSIPKIGEAPISVSGRGEGYVEFTIRKIGRLTNGIFGLNEGDTLFMRGPYGTFWPIDDFKGKDLVVICGGTGMAPVRTMLNYFYDNPDEISSVWLICGFKDMDSVLFYDEIEKFRKAGHFHVFPTLDSGACADFLGGMVTAHIPSVPFSEFKDYNIAIVGPPVMMHFSALECLKASAAEEKIWLSFERKMSCALGHCGHCKINETYVCLEGPVFNYTKGRQLFD